MSSDRITSPWRVAATGLLLLPGLCGLAAADLDVAIGNNTVVDAQLEPADEVETYRITVAAGSKVSVSLKAKPEKKATPVAPTVVVLDAADAVVATGVAKGKSVKLKGFVPETTGTYRVVVTGDGATSGAYQLKARWKAPKKVKREVLLDADDIPVSFAAAPGSTATLKAKAAKGSVALPRLVSIDSADDQFSFGAFDAAKEGAKSHKQKSAPLGPQRDYELVIGNAGEAGGAVVDIKLKAPKPPKVTVDLSDPSIGGGSSTGASGGKPATSFGGVIGPEGGSSSVDDLLGGILGGTGISVPAGALSTPVAITFGEAVNPLPSPDGEVTGAGPTVFFGPEGLEFGIPATVTIPFDLAALPGGTDSLVIYARDEDGTLSPIPPPYGFDLDAGTCSFQVSHFTSFRAFARPPLITLENEQIVVPQDALAGDHVGASVALHGDTLVFGAPDEDSAAGGAGAVYVYVRRGNAWAFEAKLTALDAATNAEFGADVAVHGDLIVVGSPGARDRSNFVTGAVYTFDRFQGQWFEGQKIIGSQTNNGGRFGQSLDFDGTTLVVGAPGETQGTGLSTAGAVYTYEPLDGLIEIERLTQTDPAAAERFGTAVALGSNDRIVVGAPGTLVPGRAFVFDRDPQQQLGGQWSQTAELFHGEAVGEEDFGTAVDCQGDVAVVTDPSFDNTSGTNSGKAYVFVRGTAWALDDTVLPQVAEAGSRFGASVTLDSDAIVVGQPGRDAPGVGGAGAVQLFLHATGSTSFVVGRFADSPAIQELFGTDVFLAGGELVVGAPGIAAPTGTVYVYDLISAPAAK